MSAAPIICVVGLTEAEHDLCMDALSFFLKDGLTPEAVTLTRKLYLPLPCATCGTDVIDERFMVRDHVWETEAGLAKDAGWLCVECLEDRLGRTLTAADFEDCLLNTDSRYPRSHRLKERLEGPTTTTARKDDTAA